MCKKTENVISNFNKLGEIAIQAIRKNKELEHYNVIANLSIEGNRDVIYVADAETHELLFMNENAQNIFGDGLGKDCFKVFQQSKEPCAFCNMDELRKDIGKPITWVFYNTHSREIYYIVDIMKEVDGRLLRFERATPLNGLTKKIIAISDKYQLS
jgi:hypothetical protein